MGCTQATYELPNGYLSLPKAIYGLFKPTLKLYKGCLCLIYVGMGMLNLSKHV